ncbi:MAG: fumarate hydratase [Candidatus Gracilibacteria bacterium]|nr:fumarate hydratase [Candidatus Gracilibacteria bacterium]
MRTISSTDIITPIKTLILESSFNLDKKTVEALESAQKNESSESGLFVLEEIMENKDISADEKMPLCQDTGVSIFFVKWGQECILEGDLSLQQVLDEAVRQSYTEGYLRKSILHDPIFDRSNTGDNTPSIIHLEMVQGDQVEISFLAKGAGADNCSQVTMLKPSDGIEGIKAFILQVCTEAGASSCPPWILGVGIGATFDSVAGLAKHAILRDVGSVHQKENYKNLEKELLIAVNQLGIGPQGLGGQTTALALHIESRPCHAASLPVAVNIQCHSNRKGIIKI